VPWLAVPHAKPHQLTRRPFPPAQTGLGQGVAIASIISGILGPVAQAGSDIYRTREEGKVAKSELKQRGVEFAQLQELQKLQLEAQERQYRLGQEAAIQQSQLRIAAAQRMGPYAIGGAAVVVGGVLMVMLLRKN
jgi:hypothetical protein